MLKGKMESLKDKLYKKEVKPLKKVVEKLSKKSKKK